MEQEIQSVISEFNVHLMIDKEYLNISRHRQNLQHSRKCVNFYQRISDEVEGYYHIIYSLPQKLLENLDVGQNEPNSQLLIFKKFLRRFFEIFTLLSNFQIQGLSKIRSVMYDSIDNNFHNFRNSIQNYAKSQEEFQQDMKSYKTLCQNLTNRYKQLLNQLKRIQQNFNTKYIKGEYDVLVSEVQKKSSMQAKINKSIQSITRNTLKFQKEIMFYRQKLVFFKYDYIEKISRLCSNSKQSLMEILTYMHDFLKQNKEFFSPSKKLEEKESRLDLSVQQRKDSNEYINRCTREYDEKIEKYLGIVRTLINILTEIAKELKDDKSRQMQITEEMYKHFEFNQCNVSEVLNTMDLYNLFLIHLGQIAGKLVYSQNNLLLLQKNINKNKEIVLSIIKCNKNEDKRSIIQRSKQVQRGENQEVSYLENLFEQMSDVYIQNILNKVFRDFEETVYKIRQKFLESQPIKKATNNSMSMSHIQSFERQPQKRPFKVDLWLWRQWRKQITKEFIELPDLDKMINEMFKFGEKTNFEQKQLEKLNCVFVQRKIKGILKLKNQGLLFESFDNLHQFHIPFYKIQSVDMQLNIMSKTFGIETVHGNLNFSDESAKDIKRFYVAVQKALDVFNQNDNEGKVIQNVITISEEDIQFIKQRKASIQKDLQNLAEFEHYNTIILEDVTINDVYRVIFSDNKVLIKGKEYECFMDSLMKKFNNINAVYQKFQQYGPQFYCGVPGIDFRNCPLYSQRKIQYDHTLPKIPFMPETCHNNQTVRVYWVSNEEIHIRETNMTSGAPYTENFIITLLTTVHKILEDIQIRFFIKVTIVTDFSLRKMVIKTAVDEAKWGNGIFAQQCKKIMLSYKRKNSRDSGKNQKMEESNFSDKTRVKEFKKTIGSLQKRNKMLLFVIIGVFILNILINIIF